jgi:CRP-like cAMP-binding protein
MTKLKDYIHHIGYLSEQEWLAIESVASLQQLGKEEVFVWEGDRCDKEVFVESGIVRGYRMDDDGNEKSTAFFQAGEFMSTSTLRTNNNCSLYSYQALCDTTIWLFTASQLKTILSQTKKLSALGKEIKEREINRLSNRDNCLMQVKATSKYLTFLAMYPHLESLISQRYIASYLGITPVSLSRLKKELAVSKAPVGC